MEQIAKICIFNFAKVEAYGIPMFPQRLQQFFSQVIMHRQRRTGGIEHKFG